MAYEKIKVAAFKCKCDNDGCGHEWISYRENLPTHCPNPKCTNPTKWNGGKRNRKAKPKE